MIPLETVDISPGDVTAYQEIASWILLAVVLFGIAIGRLAMRHYWLDEEQRRHLRAIRPAIVSASWQQIPISDSEDHTERLSEAAAVLDGDAGSSVTPFRDAIADLQAWVQAKVPPVPTIVVRAGVEGVLVLGLVALLALPLSWWEGALSLPSGDAVSVQAAAGKLLEGLGAAAGFLAVAIEATVPGGLTTVLLPVSLVLQGGKLLLGLALPVGAALLTLAAVVAWVDHRTPEDLSEPIYSSRRSAAASALLSLGIVYAVAAVPTALGRGAAALVEAVGGPDYPLAELGEVLGAIAGVIAAGWLGYQALLRLKARLYDRDPGGGVAENVPVRREGLTRFGLFRGRRRQHLVATGILVWRSLAALVWLAVPVLGYLVLRALAEGAVFRPFRALLGLSGVEVLMLLSGPIVVGAYALRRDPERVRDLGLWLRRGLVSRAMRSTRFAQGVPIMAVVIGGLVGWAFVNTTAALIGAALAGVIVRVLLLAVERGRVSFGSSLARSAPYLLGGVVFVAITWRADAPAAGAVLGALVAMFATVGRKLWRRKGIGLAAEDEPDRPPTDQVVEIPSEPIEDGDGEPLYVARVDGRSIMRRSPEGLLHDVETVVSQRFEDGDTPPVFGHTVYDEAIQRGVVEESEVLKALRGDVSTRVKATLSEKDGVEIQTLEEELDEEYPDPLPSKTLDYLRHRGDIGVRDGEYVLLS